MRYKDYGLMLHQAHYENQLYLVPLNDQAKVYIAEGHCVESSLIEVGSAIYGECGIEVVYPGAIPVVLPTDRFCQRAENCNPSKILTEKGLIRLQEQLDVLSDAPEAWEPEGLEDFLFHQERKKKWNETGSPPRKLPTGYYDLRLDLNAPKHIYQLETVADYKRRCWLEEHKERYFEAIWLEENATFFDAAIATSLETMR